MIDPQETMIEPAITFVQNPEHKCEFDYNIYGFVYNDEKRKRGILKFRPFPFSSEEWCLELAINRNDIEVHAVRLADMIGHFRFSGSINVKGKPLEKNDFCKDVDDFHGTHCLLALYPYEDLFQRPYQEDVRDPISFDFTFIVELKFSSYDISPYISRLPERDLEVGSRLVDDLNNMRWFTSSCDVTFCLDGGELKAHKPILFSRCPYFTHMFVLEPDTNRVVIECTNMAVFEAFLNFLYTDQIPSENVTTVLLLYKLAEKYEVPILKKACSQVLRRNIKSDNFCEILIFSHVNEDVALKQSTMRYVWDCFREVAMTNKWFSMVNKYPELASEVLDTVTRVIPKTKK